MRGGGGLLGGGGGVGHPESEMRGAGGGLLKIFSGPSDLSLV